MANENNSLPVQTSNIDNNLFVKGMTKDPNSSFVGKQNWTHARNAINNSAEGDFGVIGNEPANLKCAEIPYTVIGGIHLYGDNWIIFSTDDTNSEIGQFDDSQCKYTTIVNDPCLSFNRKNLVTGVSKENFDCSWQVYWDDGNNPSRTLNLSNIPYMQSVTSGDSECVIYENDLPLKLNCERIRLAPLYDTPCVEIKKAENGGQLRNGTYQAFIADNVNEQVIGDYIGISNTQSLFDHNDLSGSLDIFVTNLDKEFEFYQLVLVSSHQKEVQAKLIGLYSTEQSKISVDYIDPKLISIPLDVLTLRNPAYEKSQYMYSVNDYIIRSEPTEQFDFNYQPLANKIESNWVSTRYPADYYYNGGNKTTFMRDEQYPFFIRFVYNTGERSSSFHIPGREPGTFVLPNGNSVNELDFAPGDVNNIHSSEKYWQIYNTASKTTPVLSEIQSDGGVIVARGKMGYWESTERYPATDPTRWDELCGKAIRHHKFPDEQTDLETLNRNTPDNQYIHLLGVEFSNIAWPVDNYGNLIPNIVGFEFLVGSREGHKSIIAKGLAKNMRTYLPPEGANNQEADNVIGLLPNYPYNDNGSDPFLSKTDTSETDAVPYTESRADIFSFHSPDTSFNKPFLSPYEIKSYGLTTGKSLNYFTKSEEHPQNKLLKNLAAVVALVVGAGYAIAQMKGKRDIKQTSGTNLSIGQAPFTLAMGLGSGGGYGLAAPDMTLGFPFALANTTAYSTARLGTIAARAGLDTAFTLSSLSAPGPGELTWFNGLNASERSATLAAAGHIGPIQEITSEGTSFKSLPDVLEAVWGFNTFTMYTATGGQEIIDIIYNLISYQDYAYKYNGHGLFSTTQAYSSGIRYRSKIDKARYVQNSFQNLDADYKINNLYRPKTVVVKADNNLVLPTGDNSRVTIGSLGAHGNPTKPFIRNIEAHYVGLKLNFENQYGQLDGIKQVPIRGCIEFFKDKLGEDSFGNSVPATTSTRFKTAGVLFGGDVYINRYTEKCIMPLFWDFLKSQPDGFPYDYRLRKNVPHPTYWMNTQKYDLGEAVRPLTNLSFDFSSAFPSAMYNLDGDGGRSKFSVRNAYMYTHVNGINDFFVESEINVAHRDWEDRPGLRHYDWKENTDLIDLFHSDTIKEGNFYKYDYALSKSKFFTQLISFGNIQARDYDPYVSEFCYINYPKRLIYSLQAQKEAKKDFWRVYLPQNYKDFTNKVNVIKPVSKSGAIILFPNLAPVMFQGVDSLETDLGTKLTIGDGGLFSQPLQNIVNADLSHEYGSCESARSVINTPYGLFYISQAQGKIFQYAGSLENIANLGMKQWFNQYLPSRLLKAFPNIEDNDIVDNPVIGVGCQSVYDPNYDIVYFTKKDFVPNSEYTDCMGFDPEIGFYVNCDSAEIPTCEPGYTYNLTTNMCEKFVETSNVCPPGYTYDATTQTCTAVTRTNANCDPVVVTTQKCYKGFWETNDPEHPGGGNIVYVDANGDTITVNNVWLEDNITINYNTLISTFGVSEVSCSPEPPASCTSYRHIASRDSVIHYTSCNGTPETISTSRFGTYTFCAITGSKSGGAGQWFDKGPCTS